MGEAVHSNQDIFGQHTVSRHAWQRMSGRGLSPDAVGRVISYGRVVHVRGAMIYVVGRKEVERFGREGIDLSDVEGNHVVCSSTGMIITVYRNHDFRGLRPRRCHTHRRPC